MIALGERYQKGHADLNDIAQAEAISVKYLSQIIIPLKHAGLIVSFRGAHGGYMLAKDPQKITLWDVYMVLEGSASLAECINDPGKCGQSTTCVTRALWGDLGKTIEKKMAGITIADLVDGRNKAAAAQAIMYNI